MNDGYFFFQTMSQSNFLLSLQSFAKDTINDEMVELLAPYLEMEDYNMETAKRVSNGCIYTWRSGVRVPDRTNTYCLKITEENVLSLRLHLQMVRLSSLRG